VAKSKLPKRKTGSPQASYRSAIVSFIDILGFREIVQNSSASDVLRTLRLVQETAAPAEEKLVPKAILEREVNRTKAIAFSDSIVRVRHYDAEYNEGSLFHELISLVHMQAELANSGVFIRGGLSIGGIFFEKNEIFGPALIRAYDLESQYANVPRIVIGPEVFQEFRRNRKLRAEHHNLADEIHYIKKLVRRGDDGMWFVDYLKAIYSEMDDPAIYPQFLERHRDFIVERAGGTSIHGRALQKYLWLAEYHNLICSELGDDATDLRIAPEQLSGMETLPEISEYIRD
jgi:hypothetical protein